MSFSENILKTITRLKTVIFEEPLDKSPFVTLAPFRDDS